MKRLPMPAVLAAALALPLALQAASWVGTWGAAPLPPTAAGGPFPATPAYSNLTIRQIVRISAGGERVRVRFTNEYGTRPLVIGAAHVAFPGEDGSPQSGTDHVLTFAGKPGVEIPAGSPYLSDPIELPVKALTRLVISIYLPQDTGPCTCHAVGMQDGYVSESGDFSDKPFTPKETLRSRAFISGVEVTGSARTRTLVVLGDSISDGVGSTPSSNRRWPDLLAERLAAAHAPWGIVNMGISGNRVLADGAGQSALARLDRDVLSVAGAAAVVVFEGVNDLGISYGHFEGPMAERFKALASSGKVTPESMIAGYRQIIARAHDKGLKVFGATIAPYEGAGYYSPEGEAVRLAINQWMRSSHEFDAVLDFDAVLRDPAKPSQIAAELHAGDHLHGSDAGYRAVAQSIDLRLFK